MNALLQLWEAIKPYSAAIGLVITWAGIAYVALSRRLDWSRKRFDRISFSLNYIVNWLDGDMKLVQGATRLPPNGPLIQPTYPYYRTAEHELLLRAAISL